MRFFSFRDFLRIRIADFLTSTLASFGNLIRVVLMFMPGIEPPVISAAFAASFPIPPPLSHPWRQNPLRFAFTSPAASP